MIRSMSSISGQLAALIVALCWAQNSILYSSAGRRAGSYSVAHIRLWIALPMVILLNLLFTGELLPAGYQLNSYLYLLSSGVIGFFLADILIFRAYVLIGGRKTLVILTSSPILTAIAGTLYLDQHLDLLQLSGILTTVLGIILVLFSRDRAERAENEEGKGVLFAWLGALCQAAAMIGSAAGMGEGIHPVSANYLRILAGFVCFVLYSLITGRFLDDFRAMDRKVVTSITAAAAAGPILGISLTMYALSVANAAVVTAISQISPVILLIYERIFLQAKPARGSILGTVTATLGVALLVAR